MKKTLTLLLASIGTFALILWAGLEMQEKEILSPPAPMVPTLMPSPAAEPSPSLEPTPTLSSATPTPATPIPTVEPPPPVPTEAPPLPTPVPTEPPAPADVRKAIPLDTSVVVLGYHRFCPPGERTSNIYTIQADSFDNQMAYLRDNGYHVISMADFQRFLKKEIGLPRRAVLITIDDGFRSVHTYAYPILKKYGYPWTFFVYTDFINSGGGAVTWDQLKEMQENGAEIHSHTKSHPFLTQRRGKSEADYLKWLEAELPGSRKLLEEKLGRPVTCLAYPYGDWNPFVEQKAVEGGYEAIFTVAGNPVTPHTSWKSLGRFIITKHNENSFTSYLQQLALTIADASPAAGTVTKEARPVISATLMYDGVIDSRSVEAEVSSFGRVPVDFDPTSHKARIHLPRDIIQRNVHVTIRARDKNTGKTRVVNWQFYYEKQVESVPTNLNDATAPRKE
jgi:peptidoglycan/xylan/chitin deacetylase (PgdA/CDA1 family)